MDGRKLLGRLSVGVGRVEQLDVGSVWDSMQVWPNALRDPSGQELLDLDGRALYEPGAVLDNPLVPLRIFETVSDMLDYPGHLVNQAVTLNWQPGDGNMQKWEMVADHRILPNGLDTFPSNDAWGYYRSFSCRGETSDDQFPTRREVNEILGTTRYTHSQGYPLETWTINHGLGRSPNVVIEDISGHRVLADIVRTGSNSVEIRFANARSGTAYLS